MAEQQTRTSDTESMEVKLDKAKKELADLLDTEWGLRATAPNDYLRKLKKSYPNQTDDHFFSMMLDSYLFIRKGMDEIIAHGQHQIVLSLGGAYVGKTQLKEETPTHYVLAACATYDGRNKVTINNLRDLGFDVPEHHFVGIKNTNGKFEIWNGGGNFMITDDLRENGRCRVEDVNDAHFNNLINGEELKKEFDKAIDLLTEINNNSPNFPRYFMRLNGHVKQTEPEEALRHIFLMKIDTTTNRGKIIPGDIDHIFIYNNW